MNEGWYRLEERVAQFYSAYTAKGQEFERSRAQRRLYRDACAQVADVIMIQPFDGDRFEESVADFGLTITGAKETRQGDDAVFSARYRLRRLP